MSKINFSVSVDSEILSQLEDLTLDGRRSRSEIINKAMRDHISIEFGDYAAKMKVMGRIQARLVAMGYRLELNPQIEEPVKKGSPGPSQENVM